MDSKTSERIKVFAALAIGFGLGIPIYAYALAHLWSWFAVPLGAPALGMAQAFGLSVLVQALCPSQARQPPPDEEADKAKRLIQLGLGEFFRPLLYLGAGWVVHAVVAL